MFALNKNFIFILTFGLVLVSCKKDPEVDIIVQGCKDPTGDNYNANADEDNGSCTYQKRFISLYDINVLCGAASAIFNNAGMEIKENPDKVKVNFNISSLAGNILFDGKITKNDVTIDTIIQNLVVNAKAINPTFPDENIKANVSIKSKMTLSSDARKLTGDMDVVISNNEPVVVSGITIPPGQKIEDKCSFTGTKK